MGGERRKGHVLEHGRTVLNSFIHFLFRGTHPFCSEGFLISYQNLFVQQLTLSAPAKPLVSLLHVFYPFKLPLSCKSDRSLFVF